MVTENVSLIVHQTVVVVVIVIIVRSTVRRRLANATVLHAVVLVVRIRHRQDRVSTRIGTETHRRGAVPIGAADRAAAVADANVAVLQFGVFVALA